MNVDLRPGMRPSSGRIGVTAMHALTSHPPLVQTGLFSGKGTEILELRSGERRIMHGVLGGEDSF